VKLSKVIPQGTDYDYKNLNPTPESIPNEVKSGRGYVTQTTGFTNVY